MKLHHSFVSSSCNWDINAATNQDTNFPAQYDQHNFPNKKRKNTQQAKALVSKTASDLVPSLSATTCISFYNMRTFSRKKAVIVKVESSPNSKKVSLFNDITSDDEKKGRRKKKSDTFEEDIFDDGSKPKKASPAVTETKKKRSSTSSTPSKSSPGLKTPTKKSPKVGSPKTPTSKSPRSSGGKRKQVEVNFFKDDDFAGIFDFNSSSEDEDETKKEKPVKKPKRTSEPKRSEGKEQVKKDTIIQYLDGLKSLSVDLQCSSASSLAQMFSEGSDDLGMFMRA